MNGLGAGSQMSTEKQTTFCVAFSVVEKKHKEWQYPILYLFWIH